MQSALFEIAQPTWNRDKKREGQGLRSPVDGQGEGACAAVFVSPCSLLQPMMLATLDKARYMGIASVDRAVIVSCRRNNVVK